MFFVVVFFPTVTRITAAVSKPLAVVPRHVPSFHCRNEVTRAAVTGGLRAAGWF